MMKKHFTFQKLSGITPYIWTIFFILPFYFIWKTSSTFVIIVGIILTLLFFGISICFCLKRLGYLFVGVFVNWHFNCLYYAVQLYLFCFFIAYFIGNIKERVPFIFYITSI